MTPLCPACGAHHDNRTSPCPPWKPATRDGLCCNGDGRPVHRPSKVLCRECFAALDAKMNALLQPKKAPDAGREE